MSIRTRCKPDGLRSRVIVVVASAAATFAVALAANLVHH
jgi:hypothetical protein